MARKDLAYGQRTIARLLKRLEEPSGLAHRYAEAVLQKAIQNAASRPTPQAPMAAANLKVTEADIGPAAGGVPAEVAVGAEFGSGQYAQFHHASTPSGLWLWPAGEQIASEAAGDNALEDVMDEVIRGAI